jgi:hypothetical protein
MLLRTMRRAFRCRCAQAVCVRECRCDGVVRGNTPMWPVLSEKTSTRVPAGMTIDA